MKKIGFFGGSFDPIHFGHLHLAIEMYEKHGLDEVLFCPAFCSPFKKDQPPIASAHQRVEMLRLALEDLPQFRICTLEIERKGPSYTIHTLNMLPKAHYFFILTKESAASFSKWKNPEEIRQKAELLIGEREFPISSTMVRERLKKRLYCGHLVPAKALDYNEQHRVYF